MEQFGQTWFNESVYTSIFHKQKIEKYTYCIISADKFYYLQITEICSLISYFLMYKKGLCIMMIAWIGHFIPFLSRSIGYGPENVLSVKCTQPGK